MVTGLAENSAHANYSLWGLTDPHAPVQASGEIDIAAGRERVWSVLADVMNWTRLRSDIESVRIDAPVASGVNAVLGTGGIELQLTFGHVDAPRELNWTTMTPGLVMTNRYVLVPVGDMTHVVSNETITAPDFPQFDKVELTARIQVWLEAVKRVAEG
ncbi:MAG: SRPBCC family protein [Novosphingobium sp.]